MAGQGDDDGFIGDEFEGTVISYEGFLEATEYQLESSGVPEHLWKCVYQKIKEEVYDISRHVVELQEHCEGEPVQYGMMVTNFIQASLPTSVFVVDHAWTFELKHARQHLSSVPLLLKRMAQLTTVPLDTLDKEAAISLVMKRIWKYVQTYKMRTPDIPETEAAPLWYMTDEVGCKLRHSSAPNCRMIPLTTPYGVFCLLWPLRDILKDEELTVNRVQGVPCDESLLYQARAQPWTPTDMTHISFTQTQPPPEYFEKFRQSETLPDPDFKYQPLPWGSAIKVFFSYQNFHDFLTDDRFQQVESPVDADIVWMSQAFKHFKELSQNQPGKHVNQFPCEMVLTVKDLLAIVARRAPRDPNQDPLQLGPRWLPVTFNLDTELPQFVSYFQTREKSGLDNTWICKPWNLARGMDITITDSLHCITRLPETGPKVACKYVEDPVLFERDEVGKVKFDIRYILLLRSTQPLTLYAYQVFWLRFANIAFSLDNFEEYEKHFTVMNYIPTQLKQVDYDEFIPMFERQYPDFPWSQVEESIFAMFRELFEAAVSEAPPRGICHSPQSRAMYAVDLMLKWDTAPSGERIMVPQLCEVNFSPDCERACKYHPFFVNDVFSTLFLDDTQDKHVKLIS